LHFRSTAQSVANLLQRNQIITDLGIDENSVSDAGAKSLLDALSHNSTLQTLKINGNNIQTEGIVDGINEVLKVNRENARKKLLEEHPEYEMSKIKKEVKKKKARRSRDGTNKSSSSSSREKDRKSSSSNGDRQDKDKPATDAQITIAEETLADNFLKDRKKSLEEEKSTTLMSKFKNGLGLGSGGGDGKKKKEEGLKSGRDGSFC
jgi:hypothetical protein